MKKRRTILVTGGCGFIGSHFVRHALQRWPEASIINFDLLTYAGNLANLDDVKDDPRYRFVRGDVRDSHAISEVMYGCDEVVHFAAESHVDRSILASQDFLTTNIMGTHVLLEAARKYQVGKFLYIGTDEVYGSVPDPHFADETHPMEPNSPYSVAKTAGDMLVRSYFVTYGLQALITRTSNNFGPHQYPEKLIPLFITNLLEGKKVPLYGDGMNVRDWIYVEDNCEAIALVLEKGKFGESYNITSDNPRTNTEICDRLLEALGKDRTFVHYVTDRPGHDRRYAIDSSKVQRELGWKPQWTFEKALVHTVEWYRQNRAWWEPIKDGSYREYYQKQYESRLASVAE